MLRQQPARHGTYCAAAVLRSPPHYTTSTTISNVRTLSPLRYADAEGRATAARAAAAARAVPTQRTPYEERLAGVREGTAALSTAKMRIVWLEHALADSAAELETTKAQLARAGRAAVAAEPEAAVAECASEKELRAMLMDLRSELAMTQQRFATLRRDCLVRRGDPLVNQCQGLPGSLSRPEMR